MNLTETKQRLSEADRIINAQLLWIEFKADSDRRQALQFLRTLGLVVLISALFWIEIVVILAGGQ